jgi:O-antigen biosynthesis protein
MPITNKLKSLKNITQHFFLFWLIIGYRHLPLKYQTKEKIKFYFFKKFPGLKKQKSHALRCPLCLFVKSIWNKYTPLLFNLLNPAALLIKFKPYLIYEAKHIGLKGSNKPLVSIIIPIYGQIGFTIRCLKSISLNLPKCSFEIIVIDDASKDNSLDILKLVKGIKVFKNATNRGFIYSCNFAAKKAKGDYLYFLNNDTQVTEGWLDHLIKTFKDFPGAGLVGSKLVYPNGKLQEAGGIIWKDGSAWNFGRYQDPNDPVFNYAREVDYCSGASIMIPKTIFNKMKGFDPYYSPAYCEDSDLALKLRSRGYRVIYQPLSTVVHFEGITSGKDMNSGVKSYQIENSKKLFQRWQKELKQRHLSGHDVDYAKDRDYKYRVLVIDTLTPTPDQDAGSVTALNMMLLLKAMQFQITFIPEDNYSFIPKYTEFLQGLGIEALYLPYIRNVKDHVIKQGSRYNLVYLCRPYSTYPNLSDVIKYCKNAKFLYETADIHFIRLMRQAEISKDKNLIKIAKETEIKETHILNNVDASIIRSAQELKMLHKKPTLKKAALYLFSLIMPLQKTEQFFSKRNGIVFIGGFNHRPNVDAVLYFVNDVMPLVLSKKPDLDIYIIGSNAPVEIKKLATKNLHIVGFVEDLKPYLNKVRLSFVPLRYGAGVKGKIGTSMAAGLPVVTTSVGAEGMGVKNRRHCLIEDDPQSFAHAILKLYEDEKLWNNLRLNGLFFVENHFGADTAYTTLAKILKKLKITVPVKPTHKIKLYEN